VTNRGDYAAAIKMLREHGQSRRYHHDVLGYNYRPDEIQSAALRVKLRHLDKWTEARRRLAGEYRGLLAKAGVELVEEMKYGRAVYHLFPIFSDNRDALAEHLKASGVATGIHYPIPVHLQPAFADLEYRAGDLPVTELVTSRELSIPLYPELSEQDLATVAAAVCRFGDKHADAQA
jgi:dTDP-4-amino-4,6-dideoxygalactose transaminase